MIKKLYFKENGTLKFKQVDGFCSDVAKDMGGYSHSELRAIVGIESGAVLAVAK